MSLADRVFCFTEADHYFPLATCTALPRHSSDHTPILWESDTGQRLSRPQFRFEKWWLQYEKFEGRVANTRALQELGNIKTPCYGNSMTSKKKRAATEK